MDVQDLAIKIRITFSCSDLNILDFPMCKWKGMRHAVAHKKLVLFKKYFSSVKYGFKSYFSKSLKWEAGFEFLSMTSKAAVDFSP